MEKTYTRINWVNESVSQTTPLGATNLNTMDYALNEVDNRVITLDTTKALESEVLPMLADVAYNATTGVFTFTRKNGTTVTADINIEKIPVSFSMDENGVITMTTTDGSTYTADVGSLIKTYTFSDSSTVDFTTTIDASGNKTVTASVIDGSITGDKLNPDYLAEINGKVQTATSAAESAGTSAGTASTKATESTSSATESKSWAVGGTNTREGEDTNNAKYWCEQAAATSGIGTGNLILSQNGVEKGFFNANSYADIEIDLDGKPDGYDELVEDVEALDSTVKSKGDALSIKEVGTQKQLCLMSGDRRLSFVPMPDGGAKAYTTSEWEALDHSTISDGTQIVITDDYDSNICSTIAECEASESVDDVAGASALKELANRGEVYSTSEQVVGKWIDNKPIYRKIIETTTNSVGNTSFPSINNSKNISIGTTVDKFISIIGVITKNGTNLFAGQPTNANEYVSLWARNNSHATYPNTIACSCGAAWINTPLIITVEYTKTTD